MHKNLYLVKEDSKTSGIRCNEVFNLDKTPNSVPGAIRKYQLKLDVEEPFEPITDFAIWESERFGPLNDGSLKRFLQEKLEISSAISKEEIKKYYTKDIAGFVNQLLHLRYRIFEIRRAEKNRNDLFKIRIRDLEENVLLSPTLYPMKEIQLSQAVKIALEKAGSEGPLNCPHLIFLLIHGFTGKQFPSQMILEQLNNFRACINDNMDIERNNFLCERILRKIELIIEDLLSV